MNVLDHVRLIVYRFHEKGLEILMVDEGQKLLRLPNGELDPDWQKKLIELEPIRNDNGEIIQAYAIEGDWHDIPSIRSLIKQDMELVKSKIKEIIPELENGTYVAIKEAFKKVMPHEYSMLKELKDILLDRNLVKNI